MRVLITVLILTLASQAGAEVIICKLKNHKLHGEAVGGPGAKEFLLKRLGTQVRLNKNQNTIQNALGDQWYRPVEIEKVIRKKDATVYSFYKRGRYLTRKDEKENREPSGAKYSIRYSYKFDDYDNVTVTSLRSGVNIVRIQANGSCRRESAGKAQSSNRVREINIVQEVQKELNRLHCKVGTADGSVGPASIRGLRQFSKANKTFAYDKSVFSDQSFLKLLRGKKTGFCSG